MKNKFLIIFVVAAICAVSGFGVLSFASVNTAYAATDTSALVIEGTIATIGEYPQTRETNTTVIAALNSATQDTDGYYVYDGTRYAKVVADIYPGGNNYKDGSSPVDGETVFCKVEPIKWIVLAQNGNELTLYSRDTLDVHAWQTQITGNVNSEDCVITDTTTAANDWKASELRAWLNEDFYNKAFNSAARSAMLQFTTKAEDSTSTEDTTDYVGILSPADWNTAGSVVKDCVPSDYAMASGVIYNYAANRYYLNGFYEDHRYDKSGYVTGGRGGAVWGVMDVSNVKSGIRPVITVNKASSSATVIKTDDEKEADTQNGLLIAGIVLAVLGFSTFISAVILNKKEVKAKGADIKTYKPSKKNTALFAVGFSVLIAGLCMAILPVAINGGFGGNTSPSGTYVQTTTHSGGGIEEVSKSYFTFNEGGTGVWGLIVDGSKIQQGTFSWTQSGSTITITTNGSWGGTSTATISNNGTTLTDSSGNVYKKS